MKIKGKLMLLTMFMVTSLSVHAEIAICRMYSWFYGSMYVTRVSCDILGGGEGGSTGSGTTTGTGSGGSGGGGGGGGTTTGSGGQTTQTTPCVENASVFEPDLEKIIDHETVEPFGISPARPEGHDGIDLFAPSGTAVYAPCDGVIDSLVDNIPRDQNITINPDFVQGNQIVITPDLSMRYNPEERATMPVEGAVFVVVLDHLDPRFSTTCNTFDGKHVKKGDLIAYSDNTGKTNTGPHLHYQMRTMEDVVDPATATNCSGGN